MTRYRMTRCQHAAIAVGFTAILAGSAIAGLDGVARASTPVAAQHAAAAATPAATPAPVVVTTTTTELPVTLPGSLDTVWFVVAFAGAAVVAFGMKRLADEALHPAGSTCRLEE